MLSRQLVAFLMMSASIGILLVTFIVGWNAPPWFTPLLYIVMFLAGCLLMFQKEEKQSSFRFLKELKRLSHNFDEMTKDDRTYSLTSMARDIGDLIGMEKVQERTRSEGYDREARAFANCVALCGNYRRKQFLGNIMEYFIKHPKNLDSDILTKIADEFVNMIVRHWDVAEQFVDVINRIGYVKKNMKENFEHLRIEHNRLAGDSRSLIQRMNEESYTRVRDYVPLIAKEFTADVI